MKILFMLLLAAAMAFLSFVVARACICRTADQRCVRAFDVNRYQGTWYEIARYDARFERGLDHVQATYELQPNGTLSVCNRGTDARTGQPRSVFGRARTTAVPGHLRVSFFWIFYSDYNVLELGPEYDWALVGSDSMDYLWILSRTPELPSQTYLHILQLARRRGYDTDRLLRVDQS